MRSKIVRTRGLQEEVLKVLEVGVWMTSDVVASQIIWPPELACREVTSRARQGGRSTTLSGARSALVARLLSYLFQKGKVIRRPVPKTKTTGPSYAYSVRREV